MSDMRFLQNGKGNGPKCSHNADGIELPGG
jgi:hypothetical protein